ncbi:hypothetical protein RSSM_03072 [Rhodopirellula sallentina SM41]|uniref:Uncharacterized protein n=1 Tax=Rhodopirellula sallentina SM41 TaxID=1263870 RepID=M5UHJ9_9BACT|nr:hypothetical protein RSSM_03072 [Rhodopirellula sallentina SM41]
MFRESLCCHRGKVLEEKSTDTGEQCLHRKGGSHRTGIAVCGRPSIDMTGCAPSLAELAFLP